MDKTRPKRMGAHLPHGVMVDADVGGLVHYAKYDMSTQLKLRKNFMLSAYGIADNVINIGDGLGVLLPSKSTKPNFS